MKKFLIIGLGLAGLGLVWFYTRGDKKIPETSSEKGNKPKPEVRTFKIVISKKLAEYLRRDDETYKNYKLQITNGRWEVIDLDGKVCFIPLKETISFVGDTDKLSIYLGQIPTAGYCMTTCQWEENGVAYESVVGIEIEENI